MHRYDKVPDNYNIKDIGVSVMLVRDSGRGVRPLDQAGVPVSVVA
jgi:hypothetical protein